MSDEQLNLELQVTEAIRTLRAHVGSSADQEAFAAIVLVQAFVESQISCWHCKVLLHMDRAYCEACPSECDVEGCPEEGCQERT